MSEPILTSPEVLTSRTDVICSTSIERVATGRNVALTQIGALLRQISGISIQILSIGGKTALGWAMKQDLRYGCQLIRKPEAAAKVITRNLDHGK